MYHKPVLLKESIEAMLQEDDGWYVDLTMGGGGHTAEFLKNTSNAKMLAFDQDPDTWYQIPENERLKFVPSNFQYLVEYLEYLEIEKVNGVIADLGVSSFQIDELDRGFTFRGDVQLDMRMDQKQEKTAVNVLNEYKRRDLQDILSKYGEVRNAKTLSEAIVHARKYGGIYKVSDLVAILDALFVGKRERYYAQVFQAIRIEINDEMGALRKLLAGLPEVVGKGGRVVFLSYHSLEDRMIKFFLKKGIIDNGLIMREGKKAFKMVNKKVIRPSHEEIKLNPRARSAKMRIGEKI